MTRTSFPKEGENVIESFLYHYYMTIFRMFKCYYFVIWIFSLICPSIIFLFHLVHLSCDHLHGSSKYFIALLICMTYDLFFKVT